MTVEIWDKDQILDDLVGNAVTDSEGRFQIEIDTSKFQNLFLDRKQDFFFKILRGAEVIKSTEDSVLWNVDAAEAGLTIEVDPPPPSATEKYSVQVTVRRPDGAIAGIVCKAFDVDLRKETFLGESTTDERGRCSICYTPDQLGTPGKERADLLVRAIAADGDLLCESEILFNANPLDKVKLIADVPEPIELAEHDKLRRILEPVVGDLQAADLTDKNIEYLLKKLDGEPIVDERRLRILAEGSRIARDSGLPPDLVYGLAHGLSLSLPLSLDALLQHEDASIRSGLARAVDEKVVSSKLSESIDDQLARLAKLKLHQGLLVQRTIAGRLVNEDTGKPLRGYHVRASHFGAEEEPIDLGYDVTDNQGHFTFSIVTLPDDASGAGSPQPERLALTILDPQRNEIHKEEFEIGPEWEEVLEVTIPPEQLPQPPVHPIAVIATELELDVPEDLRTFLAEHSIETLEDVRRVGGLRRLENLPVGPDHPTLNALDAQANLSVLPTSTRENECLIAAGFPTFSAIAKAPQVAFTGAVGEAVGMLKSLEIHATALAQNKLLDGILAGIRTNPSDPRMPHFQEVFSENCHCRDCEAAVSPGAYLADLVRYATDHVRDDGQAISVQWLANLLHQPFGDLPVSCEASQEQVRQVRICVEVLRSYGAAPTALAAEEDYVLDARNSLLSKIGTSYEELQLSESADDETRLALASRLGLEHPDHLQALALQSSSIDEATLERLFGVVDTTRHPLWERQKRPETDQQILRWQLNGVEWRWNTSPEGIVHVTLSHSPGSVYSVHLYRDRERQQRVAYGHIDGPQGIVELSQRNDSGLTGSIDLDYSAATNDIALIALPEVLCWRMQHLHALWCTEDGISDLYGESPPAPNTETDLLPVIDPDVIGPDDFRLPFPKAQSSDPDGPFDLWIARRSWIDAKLEELRVRQRELAEDGLSDSEVVIGLLQHVSEVLSFELPWPAEPPQPSDLASFFEGLSANLAEGVHVEETELKIREELGLTVNSFMRLQELYAQAKLHEESQEELTEDEWEEIFSILVQVEKRRLFSEWRIEERHLALPEGQILFGPRYFWVSLRESTESAWPIHEEGKPFIDPEFTELPDLPEPTAGHRAIAIWQARRAELDNLSENLRAEYEAGGSNAFANLLNSALGTDRDWATYLPDLLNRAGQAEVTGTEEERAAIREELEELHLELDDVTRLVEVQTHTDSRGEDWDEIYALLTRCRKERQLWETWNSEEQEDPVLEGRYWLSRKARLPKWRALAADRVAWQQALQKRSRIPTVEPDLVDATYMRGLPTARAFHLWEERAQWIGEQVGSLRSQREQIQTPLVAFDAILIDSLFGEATEAAYRAQYQEIYTTLGVDNLLIQALGFSQHQLNQLLNDLDSGDETDQEKAAQAVQQQFHLTVDDFRRLMELLTGTLAPLAFQIVLTILTRASLLASFIVLSRDENHGINRASRLAQLGLTNASLSRLANIRELLRRNVALQDSAWEDVYSILAQVRKIRAFGDWRAKEQEESICLSPDLFKISVPPPLQFPPPEPADLPAWRASWRDLRTWRDTLESRVDQLETVASALKEAVSATEAAVLPKLRDALIMAANVEGNDLSTKADNLADMLLIDTRISGCALTNRLSQAITTMLGLLWALHTRQLQSVYPDLALEADDFDDEWKWIGSYESWRSAMFIHLYPENLLAPTLRPRQTPGFDELLKTIHTNQLLTPERACLAAKEYSEYFQDVCTLTIDATCYGETRIFTADGCSGHAVPVTSNLFYMFGIGGKSGRIYWAAIDPQDENSHTESFWTPVPGLDHVKPTQVVGSVPYRKAEDQRFIVLILLAEEDDVTQLLVTKYDLEAGGNPWDNEPKQLDLPQFEIGSIVTVQSDFDEEPPRLAFHALYTMQPEESKVLLFYVRSLSTNCDDWEKTETNFNEGYDPEHDTSFRDWRPLEGEWILYFVGAQFLGKLTSAAEVLHAAILIEGDEPTIYGKFNPLYRQLYLCFSCRSIRRRPDLNLWRIENYTDRSNPTFEFAERQRDSITVDEGVWIGALPLPGIVADRTRWLLYFDCPWGTKVVPTDLEWFLDTYGPRESFPARQLIVVESEAIVPLYGKDPASGVTVAVFRKASRIASRHGVCTAFQDFTLVRYRFVLDTDDRWYQGHIDETRRSHPCPECPPECQSDSPTVGDLTDAFEITMAFSAFELQDRRELIRRVFNANLDESELILTYLEEAYYFVPLQLAMQLQRDGSYAEALEWIRTVYDFNAPSQSRKIADTLVREDAYADDYQRVGNWLVGLNPHRIAQTRGQPYTTFTLLVLVRVLLDYADAEFTTDTSESIHRATSLYTKALDLLNEHQRLQRLSHTCEEKIAELTIAIGQEEQTDGPAAKALWDAVINGLYRINTSEALTDAIDEVKTTMEDAGSWQSRVEEALHVVEDAAHYNAKRIEEVLASQDEKSDTAYTLLLSDPLVLEGVFKAAGSVEGRFQDVLEGDTNAHPGSEEGELDMVNVIVRTRNPEPYEYQPFLFFDFCIPPNPLLNALRLKAELNLFKIRTCRNIAGMERQLEPYSAPTDTVSGLPMLGGEGGIVLPGTISVQPTPYRYQILVERAKQLAQMAAQYETAMLSALQQRDTEYLQALRANQGVEITRQGVRLQDLRVREAEDGVVLAELQRDRAEILVETYQEWIMAGLNEYEQDLIEAYDLLGKARATAATLNMVMSSAQAFATAKGVGGYIYAAIWAAQATGKGAAEILAIRREEDIQRATLFASHERRKDEWKLQKAVSEQDVRIGNQQIRLSQDHVRVVGQERQIAETQAGHAQEVAEFLANKDLDVELYDWMGGVLQGVYSFFLQQATAMAKLAENQLAFERQEIPPLNIQTDYWQAPADFMATSGMGEQSPNRLGLTGSARLLQDIYKLDEYAFKTNRRKLQLTKTISLASLAPWEFQRFRETGVIGFETPMAIFDRDFPGHYLRLIKQVRTSVIALIPPVSGIHAKLSAIGLSRVVIGTGGLFQETTIRRYPESVALSSPINATGLFELTPETQQMLLPFEGMGVDTKWEFQMPKAANLFDYNSIADVLISIDYTALDDYLYHQQVIRQLDDTVSADQPFSFRYQLADQWYDLHNPDQTATPMTVRFETRRHDFPANLDELRMKQVVLYFSRRDGASFEIPVKHLHYTAQASAVSIGGSATSVDGLISTRSGNAEGWRSVIGQSPVGQWELALPNTRELRDRFENGEIEDILFVLTYSGRTPSYPV